MQTKTKQQHNQKKQKKINSTKTKQKTHKGSSREFVLSCVDEATRADWFLAIQPILAAAPLAMTKPSMPGEKKNPK